MSTTSAADAHCSGACTSVTSGSPVRSFTSSSGRKPSSRPGPRVDVTLVRLEYAMADDNEQLAATERRSRVGAPRLVRATGVSGYFLSRSSASSFSTTLCKETGALIKSRSESVALEVIRVFSFHQAGLIKSRTRFSIVSFE